jgi:tRNA synthetases class II core domain (F)
VLAAAGLPGRSGLALGMGLDRLLMLVKHIPDIRLLRSVDPRIAGQMLDLARALRGACRNEDSCPDCLVWHCSAESHTTARHHAP